MEVEQDRYQNLFKELQQRDLTDSEQKIIQDKVEKQRKLFAEYEERETKRKVEELKEIITDLSDEEATLALKYCNGREEEAIEKLLTDTSFQRLVRGTSTYRSAAPRTDNDAIPRGPPRSRNPGVPFKIDDSAGVFQGRFKGKLGPHQMAQQQKFTPRPILAGASEPQMDLTDFQQQIQANEQMQQENTPEQQVVKESELQVDQILNDKNSSEKPTNEKKRKNNGGNKKKQQSSQEDNKLQQNGGQGASEVLEVDNTSNETEVEKKNTEKKRKNNGGKRKQQASGSENDQTNANISEQQIIDVENIDDKEQQSDKKSNEKKRKNNSSKKKQLNGNVENDQSNGIATEQQTIDLDMTDDKEQEEKKSTDKKRKQQSKSDENSSKKKKQSSQEESEQHQNTEKHENSLASDFKIQSAKKERSFKSRKAVSNFQKLDMCQSILEHYRQASNSNVNGNDQEVQILNESSEESTQSQLSPVLTNLFDSINKNNQADSIQQPELKSIQNNSHNKQQNEQIVQSNYPQEQQQPEQVQQDQAQSEQIQQERQEQKRQKSSRTTAGQNKNIIRDKDSTPHYGRIKQKGVKKAELINVGELRPEKGWFNAGYIFPLNFESRTIFRSSVHLDATCVHTCQILEDPNPKKKGEFPPLFRVVAADRPNEPVDSPSCTGCWTGVLKRIRGEIAFRISQGEDLPPPPKTAIAGPEYFGLNQPDIVQAIQTLDPDHVCEQYWQGQEALSAAIQGQATNYVRVEKPSNPTIASTRTRREGGSRRNRGGANYEQIDDEDEYFKSLKWSGVDRAERYKRRQANDNNDQDGGNNQYIDDDNPLPEYLDPITLEPVVTPAISPYGHVMGMATWKAVLGEQNKCPFTKKPLRAE